MTRSTWLAPGSQRLLRAVPAVLLTFAITAASASPAMAADPPSAEAKQDAGKHFQRGVALFSEADYSGALAEFKRAYELAPNYAVLWNIGQTYYQLRQYAAALTTFERYMSEGGAGAEHAKEAQAALDTLRARVGKLDITAPDGAEISIDDEIIGKTPLPPVQVAVGKRKIIATKDGRSSAPKFVEVTAGETSKAEVKLDEAPNAGAATAPTTSPSTDKPAQAAPSSSALPIILWVSAGVLAAGAVTTGILTSGAESDLDSERKKFPSSRDALDDASDKTKTLALVTDILGATAIVVAGVALYFTIAGPKSSATTTAKAAKSTPPAGTVRLRFAPNGAVIGGTF